MGIKICRVWRDLVEKQRLQAAQRIQELVYGLTEHDVVLLH